MAMARLGTEFWRAVEHASDRDAAANRGVKEAAAPTNSPRLPLRRKDPSVYRPDFWPAVRNAVGMATGMWPHLPSKMNPPPTPTPKPKQGRD
jgi:hypothetical protein